MNGPTMRTPPALAGLDAGHRLPRRAAGPTALWEALAEVADLIACPGTWVEEVMDAIARHASHLVGDGAAVRLLVERGERLVAVADDHRDPDTAAEMRRVLAATPLDPLGSAYGIAMDTLEPVLLDPFDLDALAPDAPDAYRRFAEERTISRCLIVPLAVRGRAVGVLKVVRSGSGSAPFTGAERAFLLDLAERGAWAVEHARLDEQLQARADQQAAVAELGQLALSGCDEATLMRVMLERVKRLLDADAIGWLETTDDPGVMRAKAGWGWASPQLRDGQLVPVVDGGPVDFALRHRRPVLVDDVHCETRFKPSPLLEEAGIRSSVMVVVGDPVIAVLGAHARDPGHFNVADADFLSGAANLVHAAIGHRRAETEVRRLAFCDELTGLSNRAELGRRLREALARPGQQTALLLMDLDRFKEVNDSLGHVIGDQLLHAVGRMIRAAVGDSRLVARLGGDEFAVLLEDLPHGSREAVDVARHIAHTLAKPVHVGGAMLTADASIGVALAPSHGDDPISLMQAADVAMYRAKRLGTGWAVADEADRGGDSTRLSLAAELRRAPVLGQLFCHYQPQYDLHDGRLVSVEALLRWHHPVHGLLTPVDFIDLAEHTGAQSQVAWWVFGEVLRQAGAWRRDGTPVPVAVNCSPRLLHEPYLAERLADAMAEIGLPPSDLTVEITESAVMSTSSPTVDNVNRLAELGMRVSVDDFGTGFSSLSHLQALAVHELKIDRSFVAGMSHEPRDLAIVRAIADLGRNLGLRVVAEGAESAHDVDTLRRLGVDVVQGYALAVPQPADDIPAAIRRARPDPGRGPALRAAPEPA